MRLRLLASLAMAAGLFAPAQAHGEPACGRAGKPWVSLHFAPGWPRELERAVLGDLRAGLARHDIDACLEGTGPAHEWLASVSIAWLDEPRVSVSVEVKDKLTEKRVSRDLDLTGVPQDGRSFAIALATDELVWASWVELALEPRRAESAPPEVVTGVRAELPRREAGRVGAQGAVEHFGGGVTELGADALLSVPLALRLRLDTSVGVREGGSASAPDGRVRSHSFGVAAGVRYAFFRTSSVELAGLAGVRGAWLRFEGEAAPPATDSELSGLVVTLRAGAVSALRLGGGFWLELGGTAGGVLSGLEATDAGVAVAAASGFELAGFLGVGVEL